MFIRKAETLVEILATADYFGIPKNIYLIISHLFITV